MADEQVARAAQESAGVGGLAGLYRRSPWWLRVIGIFAASRVVTTIILLAYAANQKANAWTGASPNYFDFAKIWDGHWYYYISVVGYPSVLPLTDAGQVGENAWAFMPGYPALLWILGATGADFRVLAVLVSVAFALGTALLLYKLLARTLPAGTALFAVTLFCFAPLSPIYQVAYAESMHTFFLVLALHFLVNRHYWMLLPVIAVMSLTRPSGLAFALALLLHFVYRWYRRRRNEPFPPREMLAAGTAAIFSGICGIAWLLVAWGFTGSFSAYMDTELAWRSAYIGYVDLVPFTAWFQAAGFWLQFPAGPLIVVAGAIVVVGLAVLIATPLSRRLGVDIRFWLASYLLYLLAVWFPQSSTFRLLVPMFPILGAVAQPRSRLYRAALVLLFIAGQVAWIHIAWWVDGADWTPP